MIDDFGDTNFDDLEKDLREAKLFDDDEVVDFVVSAIDDKETQTGKGMFRFSLRAVNHPTRSGQFLPKENALLPYRDDNGRMMVIGNILNILRALGVDAKGKPLSEVFGDASVYVGMEGALVVGRKAASSKEWAVQNGYLEEGEDFNFIKKYLKK